MLPIFSGMVRNSCWMSMLLMSRSDSSVGMLSNRMKHSPTCLCERPNISDTFTLNASSAPGMLRCSSDSLLKQNKGKLDRHFEHFRHKKKSRYTYSANFSLYVGEWFLDLVRVLGIVTLENLYPGTRLSFTYESQDPLKSSGSLMSSAPIIWISRVSFRKAHRTVSTPRSGSSSRFCASRQAR